MHPTGQQPVVECGGTAADDPVSARMPVNAHSFPFARGNLDCPSRSPNYPGLSPVAQRSPTLPNLIPVCTRLTGPGSTSLGFRLVLVRTLVRWLAERWPPP